LKNLNKKLRFNVSAIIFVIVFLQLYITYGRGFLSWRNFTIFVLASVSIFLIISRSRSGLVKTTFTLALIPIIPDPLGGIPVCCLILLLCFAIYGIIPGPKESIRLGLITNFNIAILSFTILIAGIVNWTPGNTVFLFAWVYGLLFILMSIRTFPKVTNSSELLNSYWVGSSITCILGLILFLLPGVKLPGISVSVNYGYLIGNQSYGRYSGILGDYELYGQLCGLSSLVSLYIALAAANSWRMVAGYITFLISIQQLLLTGTRSSIVLTMFFSALLVMRASKNQVKKSIRLPSIIALILLAGTNLKSAISQSGSISRIDQSLTNISSAFDLARGDLWQYFLSQISGEMIKVPEHLQFPISEFGTLPHSLPLALIFMFGIFPFISFMIIVLIPLVVLSRERSLQNFLLKIMLAQLLIESLKVEAIRLPQYLTVFFTLVGLCYVSAVETYELQKFRRKIEGLM
jgi:hypothetical protein